VRRRVRIAAPILITQGADDKLVRPAITKAYADELCRRGETASYRSYPGVDHFHAGPKTTPDVAAWIADRFAGARAPTTCRS
jgi:alpha-beta hydrolase superfamily lysophospholipase